MTGASAAALRVTTEQEDSTVIATLVSESATGPVDLATSSSSAPLTGPAVVPVFTDTRLALSFAGTTPGGSAQIQEYDDQGDPVGDAERVGVKPRTTVTWSKTPTRDRLPRRRPPTGLPGDVDLSRSDGAVLDAAVVRVDHGHSAGGPAGELTRSASGVGVGRAQHAQVTASPDLDAFADGFGDLARTGGLAHGLGQREQVVLGGACGCGVGGEPDDLPAREGR